MSIKNIKSIGLFLILAVLMIGVIGAVSAATPTDVGTSTATFDASSATITQTADGNPAATGDIAGKIITNATSTSNDPTVAGKQVPANTPVVAISGDSDSKLTIDTKVYDAKYEEVTGIAYDAADVTWNDDGTYTAKITFAQSADMSKLTPSTTYYVKLSLEKGGVASYKISDDTVYQSTVAPTSFYVPFTYVELFTVNVKDYNLTYGDKFEYNGTLVNDEGDSVQSGKVTIVINDGTNDITIDDVVVKNGKFSINDEDIEKVSPTNVPLSAGEYTVTATYDTNYQGKSKVIVSKLNVTINAAISDDEVYDNDWATISVNPVTANGETLDETTLSDLGLAISYTAIPKTTGTAETPVEIDEFDGIDLETQDTGKYLITVSGDNSGNYNFIPESFNYTVLEAPKTNVTINVSEDPIVVPNGGGETVTVDVYKTAYKKDETVTNIADDTDLTIVLYDVNGVKKADLPVNNQKFTVLASDVAEGSYVTIGFSKDGYEKATKTVQVVLKTGTVLTVTPAAPTYAYGGDVNITVTLKDTDGKLLNDTVSIVNGNETIATVNVVNGSAVYSLGSLNLDAGVYDLNVVYDGSDVYKSAEADLKVTVNADETLGYLTANTTKVNYNINTDATIALNLTQFNNHSALMPYTGVISYTYKDTENKDQTVNFTMTDGIATINVSDLEGIVKGTVSYNFQIPGNNKSNTVKVDVTTSALNGLIVSDNVTAHNNSIVTIKGVITNATDGTVAITLENADEDTIAMITAEVNEDGSFTASFAPIATGNYTAEITYIPGDIGANVKNNPETITVTITGAGEPTPTNGTYATVLTIEPFNETEGAGKSLVGKLALEDGTPVVGMHILLNLTRVSDRASKVYTTTTDYNGEFQFPINLGAGEYTAQATFEGVTIPSTNVTYEASESPVTPFSVTKNGTQPTNETSVIITTSPYVGTYGTVGNFTAKFTNNAGQPLVGYPVGTIEVTLTRVSSGASKTYSYFVTDYNGEITMPIELAPGQYTADIKFKGSTVPAAYDPAEVSTTLTVNRA